MTAAGAVADALRGVVADGGIRTPEAGGPWAVGEPAPGAVAFPADVDELAGLLARASEAGLRVRAAGAGSRLGALATGGPADVVVSTRRMTEIQEYVPGNLTLTAGAGLPLERLDRTTRESGQWLPQDPPGWPEATLGALAATGLPGPLTASYGRPRDQILGLTLVTGDGRVLEPGGRVVKNVAGFDLVRLAAGSRGALGVVARVTVRLFPVPAVDRTLLWRGPDAGALVDGARASATAPVLPGSLELLAPDPGRSGGGGAVLGARILGSRAAVDEGERILRDAVGRRPDDTLEGDASTGWHRDRSSEEAGAPAGSVELRLALLPSALPRLLEVAGWVGGSGGADGGSGHGLRRVHLTTGVARVWIDGPGDDDAGIGEVARRLREARAALREEGGSLTVTRAPARLLERVPVRGAPDPVAGELVAGLRREFDPAGILTSELGGRGAS